MDFTKLSLFTFLCLISLTAFANDTGLAADQGPIGDGMCVIYALVTGSIAKTVGVIGVAALGIGLFLGKLNWGVAVAVGVGVILIFGGPQVIEWLTGKEIQKDCNAISFHSGGSPNGDGKPNSGNDEVIYFDKLKPVEDIGFIGPPMPEEKALDQGWDDVNDIDLTPPDGSSFLNPNSSTFKIPDLTDLSDDVQNSDFSSQSGNNNNDAGNGNFVIKPDEPLNPNLTATPTNDKPSGNFVIKPEDAFNPDLTASPTNTGN